MIALLGLLLVPRLALAFNLEPRHAVVITDPSNDSDSYFGYALSFWQQTSLKGPLVNWLLVGAPKGNEPQLKGERVRRPGVVYKCRIDMDNPDCNRIPVLGSEDKTQQDLAWRGIKKNIPARGWLGGTIAVEDKPDGDVSIAPNSKGQGKKVYYFGWAQLGMSAKFVQNTTSTQLVVGGPGACVSRGSVTVFEKGGKGKESSGLPSPTQLNADSIEAHSLMGYSVTTARFHKDGRVSYVSGAPRAEGEDLYTGVVFVQSRLRSKVSLLSGVHMGEYFGASLAAVDLEGDGHHDLLLVGAPLHSHWEGKEDEAGGDQGKVYVYVNKGEARMEKAEVSLAGSSVSGARFGTSIAVVGDLNRDGFTDIAVGAPYEGAGVVYIYHGQAGALRSRFAQRISAYQIRHPLNPVSSHSQQSGFGISITSGVDVDGNSFNDLAIGSHEAGWVALVKSYPVVDVEASLTPSVKQLDINADHFSVSACLSYSSQAPRDQLQVIMTRMSLEVETTLQRAVFVTESHESSTLSETVTLERSKQCWNFSVNLKGNLYHVTQPIEITMDFTLVDTASINREKAFCKGCPVMDPHKSTTVQVKVPFSHGCKESNECRTDLRVDVKASNKGAPLVLGRDTNLSLDVMVWPLGDPAYLAKLSVALSSEGVRLQKLPSHCYQEEAASDTQELVVCNLGHPLVAGPDNKPVTTHFEFDLNGVTLETVQLVFNMTTWSVSEELTPGDNSIILDIPVERVSSLVIKGKQIQRLILISDKEEINKTDIPVNHEYEVVNRGPSPVNSVLIDFQVPLLLDKDGSNSAYFAHLSDTSVTVDSNLWPCRVDDSALATYEGLAGWQSIEEEAIKPEQVPPEEEELGERPGDRLEDRYQKKRRRRDVTAPTSKAQMANSTDSFKHALYLNSSNDETVSIRVHCDSGPLPANGTALVKLNLHINKTQLAHLLTSFDAVVIATDGSLTVPDVKSSVGHIEERMQEATVETVILGEMLKDQLDNRILALSIAVGLLLLLPLFKGLSMCGFFNRGDKEKLEMLKERVVVNRGPSPVNSVIIDFQVPLLLDKDESNLAYFAHLSDTSVTVDSNLWPCRVDESALATYEGLAGWQSIEEEAIKPEQVPPEEEELGERPGDRLEDRYQKERRRRDVTAPTSKAQMANSTDSFKHDGQLQYLNSSNDETVSVRVHCDSGPLPANGTALVKLNLHINKTQLAHLLTSFDAVVIATDGSLTVPDGKSSVGPIEERMQEATVETVILGEMLKDQLDNRILALSIAVGLLLLLPLFKGLSMCGFFNRGDKEKLEMLKERVQAEAEFEIDEDE